MPRRIHFSRWFLTLGCAVFAAATLHAEIRHVDNSCGTDNGNGTEKAPWRTIQHGLDHLKPGDTLVVHPGKYEGPLSVHTAGTKTQRIQIQALKNVRIESPSADVPAIAISKGSWVTLEGFFIGGGIEISGNPERLILRANALRGHGDGTGIHLASGRGVLLDRNFVTGFSDGMVVTGSGNIIRDNIVRENTRAGIVLGDVRPAQDTIVRNNTIDSNGAGARAAGGLWIRLAPKSTVENNILISGPGRNLFTAESGISGVRFAYNLYFSPNGLYGAMFNLAGKTQTGFTMIRLATRDAGAVFSDPVFSDKTASLHRSSPAIDLSPLQPFPGEKDFSGKPRKTGLGLDAGAQEFERATGLRREGNQLVHQDRLVRLRGVGIGDPVLDRRGQPLSDYELLRQKWNANVVRMSIHPFVWRNADLFGGKARVIEWIRCNVDAATKAGQFVILDWHITGWPDGFAKPSEPGEFQGLHESSFSLACDFWDQASAAFGKNGAVAFEIWNEPVQGPNDWQPKAGDWRLLYPYWERLTSIIRRHSENLVILAGGNWAYSLKGIRELPPSDPNVAFSWHVYAGKENNDEVRWASAFDNLSQDYPVIVSEWGFDENGPPSFKGGVGDFGAKFVSNWLEGRNLHWVAWCWHSAIGPAMLSPDGVTPTRFGAFVKSLLRLNPAPEPPESRFLLALAGYRSARSDFSK